MRGQRPLRPTRVQRCKCLPAASLASGDLQLLEKISSSPTGTPQDGTPVRIPKGTACRVLQPRGSEGSRVLLALSCESHAAQEGAGKWSWRPGPPPLLKPVLQMAILFAPRRNRHP